MMEKFTGRTARSLCWVILALGLNACLSSGSNETKNELPYGSSADALPSGAALIGIDEYRRALSRGFLQPLQNIPAFLASAGPALRFTGRDLRIHRVRTLDALTRGRIATRAKLRQFSPVNQLNTYSGIYGKLTRDDLDNLHEVHGIDLPTQEEFAAMNPTRRQQALVALAAQTGVIASAIAPGRAPAAGAGPFRNCTNDEGDADGSDQAEPPSAFFCGIPRDDGILANVSYPLKPYVTCVRNQGNRGTCWAFSSTSMLESAIALKHGRLMNLSEQDLINRVKLFWWPSNYGDPAEMDILDAMSAHGYREPLESLWTYNGSLDRIDDVRAHAYEASCEGYAGNCSDTSHQGKLVCADQGNARFCGYMAIDNPGNTFAPTAYAELWDENNATGSVNLAVLSLSLNTPLQIAIDLTDSFDNALTDGWVRFNPATRELYDRGAHVAHAVGYVSSTQLAAVLPSAPVPAGGGYFVVKNSWGVCAGDAGYFYAPVGYVKKHAFSIQSLTGIE